MINSDYKKLESITLDPIQIKDLIWKHYVRLVKDVIIPYQWGILNDREDIEEPSHCISNFKIAAGEMKGEFQGAVFQDTDIAKWLEAVAYVLAGDRDEELERIADETIDLIGRAQEKDGYLNTYFTIKEPEQKWKNLKEGHELYTAGHMIEAAVAYYQTTGKDKFIKIVSKLADLISEKFGPLKGQCHGYPGHQEIELALVKLYRVTKNLKYLETAKYFIDQRGIGDNYFLQEEKKESYKQIFPDFHNYDVKYSQSHQPVREQQSAEGHAVRAVYMYSAMVDLAYEYNDKELLSACQNLWNNIVQKRMYITGGIGSSGILERFTTDYDLPNDSNYSESCASIGLALFGLRMAQITRDARYYDVVERALYNTVLSGIGMDGKSFFYVNPLEVWPDNCLERTSKEHIKARRQKWFGVACCPPNIARTLASLGQYIYGIDDSSLYVNLYISNQVTADLNGNRYQIEMESEFPKDGLIRFTIERIAGEQKEIKIAFRIVGEARDFQVFRCGKELESIKIEKGYMEIEDCFIKETITIKYNAKARFIRANPSVREDAGKVAVMKGPFVYCFEEVDNGTNLASIYIDTKQKPMERFESELMNGICVITCKGKKISKANWKEQELYASREVEFEDIELKAVPYYSWGNRKGGEMMVWMKEIL
ncbi:glycoside hydrolase family 127 protein [Anaerosacchariphilus polymeriproducens]|uniref:Glycoside hydrolase family 127 protein n=1 Tax=Anaerosacchariphilus polymeriproducens TaxID=1812858 RepID=A0A371AWV6_9FIRM|nr:beta-L-arabinofuranosidase domain-containing protein [Anaerosacchariphilus polymeriproducens]RDU24057.1 glycoside hydrolase family 127 protein [Anaerosacchariphilus polymeriproducens]